MAQLDLWASHFLRNGHGQIIARYQAAAVGNPKEKHRIEPVEVPIREKEPAQTPTPTETPTEVPEKVPA